MTIAMACGGDGGVERLRRIRALESFEGDAEGKWHSDRARRHDWRNFPDPRWSGNLTHVSHMQSPHTMAALSTLMAVAALGAPTPIFNDMGATR